MGCVVGLVVAVYLIGLIVTWVDFTAARLPGDAAANVLSDRQLFGAGLRSTALTGAAFAALTLLAYLTATFHWEINGPEWHEIVRERGVGNARPDPKVVAAEREGRKRAYAHRKGEARLNRWQKLGELAAKRRPGKPVAGLAERQVAKERERLKSPAPVAKPVVAAPLGDAGVRIIAGFNMLVLAVLASLELAHWFDAILPAEWRAATGSGPFLAAWVVLFVAFHQLLIWLGPLRFGARLHGVLWVLVGVAALLASAPLGLLILTGVAISTWGRKLGRIERPSSLGAAVRSPLPWILLAIVTVLGLTYHAMPPVSFAGVAVATPSGELTGGFVNRTSSGVYLVTCTPLADATSTDERLRLVKPADPGGVALGGPSVSLDSGERPSLITLGLHGLGLGGVVQPVFTADLRPRRQTCGDAGLRALTGAREDRALGAGVIVPAARTPVARAHDGEPPIEQQSMTPRVVATLARRYQPTLLVTVADRFWPVSVGALLASRRSNGDEACLIQRRSAAVCGPDLNPDSLAGPNSAPSDYLQYPFPITHDPNGSGQFAAFQNGQYINPGSLHTWLADPGLLRPWYTAQIYFYVGPTVSFASFPTPPTSRPDPKSRQRFIPLEYWFYYPYNYFPLLTDPKLMNEAPIAADKFNVDFHQGDWEHVDVLLDPTTLQPMWLYMARHSGEGQFIQWGSPSVALDGAHPLLQAGFGGHPTYEPACGVQARNQPTGALVDWLVCGSGRFAFRAATTPLVDMAYLPWVCWPGHFGAAGTRDEIKNFGLGAKHGESILDQARGQVYVAGPLAPALQAENTGACPRPGGPEQTVAGTTTMPRRRPRGDAGTGGHRATRG